MTGQKPEKVFRGNGVSPGIALGTALKLDSRNRVVLKIPVDPNHLEAEVERFETAVKLSREQLSALRSRLEEKVGHEYSHVLDAHLLMLEDPSLISEITTTITKSMVNAEWAVRRAANRIRQAYSSLEDEYFRERGSDIQYVMDRMLSNLSGDRQVGGASLPQDPIVFAQDFNPSAFATVDIGGIRGLALEYGGRTSHTVIIARSLRLPTVIQVADLLSQISTGDPVLVDGDEGVIVVNPGSDRLNGLRARLEEFRAISVLVAPSSAIPSATADGTSLSLRANIELPHEVRAARHCGAEGIGLFRSEFLFAAHPNGFPTVDEQLATYRMLAEEIQPFSVSIRTLDTAEERQPGLLSVNHRANPSMGLRGIRRSLRTRELFSQQIEAVILASHFGEMEIILPLVSTVEEVWEAREIIEKVRQRTAPGRTVPLGAMIEVPSAVWMVEALAREVDFLCIGTNDLIQYTLAVDRTNPEVSHLFQPLHPSILACLDRVVRGAEEQCKPVRVCGEIAANPFYAALLLGLGYRHLSMNPFSIPTIRKLVASVHLDLARQLAASALSLATSKEISQFLIEEVSRRIPMDLSSYAKEIRTPIGSTPFSHAG